MAKLQIDGVSIANLEDDVANSLLELPTMTAWVAGLDVVPDIQQRGPDSEVPAVWRGPSQSGELTISIRYYLAATDDTTPKRKNAPPG